MFFASGGKHDDTRFLLVLPIVEPISERGGTRMGGIKTTSIDASQANIPSVIVRLAVRNEVLRSLVERPPLLIGIGVEVHEA